MLYLICSAIKSTRVVSDAKKNDALWLDIKFSIPYKLVNYESILVELIVRIKESRCFKRQDNFWILSMCLP